MPVCEMLKVSVFTSSKKGLSILPALFLKWPCLISVKFDFTYSSEVVIDLPSCITPIDLWVCSHVLSKNVRPRVCIIEVAGSPPPSSGVVVVCCLRCGIITAADHDIDCDFRLIINNLHALFDRRESVHVSNGASIHVKGILIPNERWEYTWNRGR